MKNTNKLVSAIITIALGIMLVILKGEVVSLAMTLLGIGLIVSAVIDVINKRITPGVIKAVIGAAVIAFGWALVTAALYVMGAIFLIIGVLTLVRLLQSKTTGDTLAVVMLYARPVIYILAGACLFFNQGGTISWVFTVSGIFLIISGVLSLKD